jgi:hypothetical protein
VLDETDPEDDAAIAALLEWRCRRYLANVAETVMHVRTQIDSGQYSERGVDMPEAVTPLVTAWVDDVDLVYAQLLRWVVYWSGVLAVEPPSTAIDAWSTVSDLQGLRAGVTPERAHYLVALQTTWLNSHAEQIGHHGYAEKYRLDVIEFIGAFSARHPMRARRRRIDALARPCLVCGRFAVHALLHGQPMASAEVRGDLAIAHLPKEQRDARALDAIEGVTIACEECGWTDRPRLRDLVGWIA